jgi:hypothetical protein
LGYDKGASEHVNEGVDMSAATVKYLTAAETAKLIRAALKAAFPGVKFSIRSESYSLGASIYVRWTGEPTNTAVRAIVNPFQGSDFDGMTDSTTPRPPTRIDGDLVHFGADYIKTIRQEA